MNNIYKMLKMFYKLSYFVNFFLETHLIIEQWQF